MKKLFAMLLAMSMLLSLAVCSAAAHAEEPETAALELSAWGGMATFAFLNDNTYSFNFTQLPEPETGTWAVEEDRIVVTTAAGNKLTVDGGLHYVADINPMLTVDFDISTAQAQELAGTTVNYLTLSAWDGMATMSFLTDNTTSFNFTQLPAPEVGTWAVEDNAIVVTKESGGKIAYNGVLNYVADINEQLTVSFTATPAQLQGLAGAPVGFAVMSAWDGMATFTFLTDKTTSFNFTQLPEPEVGAWKVEEGNLNITKSDESVVDVAYDAETGLNIHYVAVINPQLTVDFTMDSASAAAMGYAVPAEE